MASATTTSDGYPAPICVGPRATIRPFCTLDIPAIAREANNPLVARWMRNRFPHPYTEADAEAWLRIAADRLPLRNFALVDSASGALVGGIGLMPGADVEARTMEVGYWLGEAHWGRGIATDAMVAFVRWAFENVTVEVDRGRASTVDGEAAAAAEELPLLRLEAGVFDGNPASERVLRKVGFTYEGTRRNAVWKHGQVWGIAMYGLLREECLGEDASAGAVVVGSS